MKYEATSQTRKMGILAAMIALMTIVYVFGASPYAGDDTFRTLQAQGSNGAITNLTLTSDAPGTLTVSWDTASPTPTDHRIDWAKTGEDYQSWKVDEGHKYPAPSATTATIADLEHDTEYKIRLRTRYYKGEHEDAPWGGPWATDTITVAGTPSTPSNTVTRGSDPPEPALPAAPSFINTAVTEGQVLLSWFKPSDNSITGYQILRGPDAGNLVVIEDDTGSSSTSYTDTAPPAGQTHTYGVKARNSAGLSPAGTATTTVPTAEEEVLIIARHESAGNTLVSNLEQPDGSSLAEVGFYGGSQRKVAVSFTTGGNVLGYHPTGVQLELVDYSNSTTDVSIREDNAGNPSDIVLSSFTNPTVIVDEDSITQLTTFTTSNETTLQPNTKYWLQVTSAGDRVGFEQTESDRQDARSQADWSIGNTQVERVGAAAWSMDTTSAVLKIHILGHASVEIQQAVSEAGGDLAADNTTSGRLAVGEMVTGQHHAGILNVNPPIFDVDWFAFTARVNTDYQFTANPGKKGLPYYTLRIFNDQGVEQRNSLIAKKDGAYHSPDRSNILPFRTQKTGTYYVSIEAWRGNSSAVAYILAMLDDDYADETDTTATVTVSGSGQNFKDFHNYLMRTDANPDSQTTDDVDWIRVTLKDGVAYKIAYDVGCLHRGMIEGIYDSGGSMIHGTALGVREIHARSGVTTNLCTNLVTEFTPSSDGNHYIAVSARAPTIVAAVDCDGSNPDDCTVTHHYPFQGVQGTLTITDPTAAPPNSAATGNSLVRGERRVGSTLTGDTARITDANGLTNPMFEYQWQRMEDGTPADIPGEVSDTYILTNDDLGKRIRLQAQATDDDGYVETRSGPATSIVTATNPRVLVSNLSRSIGHSASTDASSIFLTGLHPHGYVIDTVTMPHAGSSLERHPPAEYRLYRSVVPSGQPLTSSYPDRGTGGLLMSASPPEEINGLNLTFGASSKVKLTPNTPYQNVLTSTGSNIVGCTLSTGGVDGDSLAGFSIPQVARVYKRPTSMYSSACLFEIKGFELTTNLYVKKVEITSTPNMEGMYTTGETIEVTATLRRATPFAEPSPSLLLHIGDNEREMEYVASSSTDTSWVFQHTVTADNRDDDGISFERNALRGYADADLSHRGVNSDPGHRVNAVAQIVSRRVSSKPIAPLWYGPGEKIQFTLGFSLPVTVVGDPQLEFNVTTPDGPEFAVYLSGSSTKELVFSYTVGTGDDDSDGIWLDANRLRLDSDDSITGTVNGLDANPDHAALNKLENHRIDQNPRAVSQEVTSDPVGGNSDTYGVGDAITFEVVFNQLVTVSGTPRLRFSITGPGDEYATYVSGSGTNTLVFSYTVLAADADTDGIYLYKNPLDYPDTATDSIVGTNNSLDAVNEEIGKEGVLSGHKIDGSITN